MTLTYNLPFGGTYAPYLIDMIQGNHVLIAGTTGAGKSVLENSILYALLATTYPANTVDGTQGAQLVLLDPKKVELWQYKNLPHTMLYADTIPDIKTALESIRVMIEERLNRMRKRGERKSSECPVYIFIDELVDLVTNKTHGKEIVRLFADTASISRAANVFYVALTQSPARAIIPAQFKLLFNCRVALFCNNAVESRQIIDDDSATTLPEHGIAIVQQNINRYKIKIPFYSDEELNRLVRHWEKQHPIINRLRRM
ncbi:MAG: hypothetical protein J6S49_08030 [Erysipelotrichaceae bacterium]|nr:hypothetical protein [Erysipelotrichaceae bacterium]